MNSRPLGLGKFGLGVVGMAIASTILVSATASSAKPCSYRAYKSQSVKEFRWSESPLAMAVVLPGIAIATALTLGARGNTPRD